MNRNWYFIVLAAALSSGLTCSSGKKLTRDDVRIALGDLRTFAASGAFLTQQNQASRLTDTFFTQQSGLVLDKVHDTMSTLDAPAGEAESERGRAAAIAQGLSDRLQQMESGKGAPDDEQVFNALSSDAEQLESSLKGKP